jgi:cyclic pyranopterin phosphate synthase
MLTDRYHRTIDYLRISVTDRCNLRCKYCIDEPFTFFPHSDILSYEEIVQVVRVAARLGIKKVRLTGGEPLVRRGLFSLIQRIAAIPEIKDLALTTNGVFLGEQIKELKEAGLCRVNVSLDTLKKERYEQITGVDALDTVLTSLDATAAAGLSPIKINTVIIKDFNHDEVLSFVQFAKDSGYQVRFIELMPFGSSGSQRPLQGVASKELKRTIESTYRLIPAPNLDGGPARMYAIDGSRGKVGFISPITTHLCTTCNRIRLTSNGKIRLCLFAGVEYDLRALLRAGAQDSDIEAFLLRAVQDKPQGKGQAVFADGCHRTMRSIGG